MILINIAAHRASCSRPVSLVHFTRVPHVQPVGFRTPLSNYLLSNRKPRLIWYTPSRVVRWRRGRLFLPLQRAFKTAVCGGHHGAQLFSGPSVSNNEATSVDHWLNYTWDFTGHVIDSIMGEINRTSWPLRGRWRALPGLSSSKQALIFDGDFWRFTTCFATSSTIHYGKFDQKCSDSSRYAKELSILTILTSVYVDLNFSHLQFIRDDFFSYELLPLCKYEWIFGKACLKRQ